MVAWYAPKQSFQNETKVENCCLRRFPLLPFSNQSHSLDIAVFFLFVFFLSRFLLALLESNIVQSTSKLSVPEEGIPAILQITAIAAC